MNVLDRSTCATDAQRLAHIPLFQPAPDRAAVSQLSAFVAALEAHTGLDLREYQALHAFSVEQYRTFWRFFVQWCEGLDYAGEVEPVCIGDEVEHARFFTRLELNYADNLLGRAIAPDTAPAVTACHADGRRVRLTRGELRERVARLAHALEGIGLRAGDRVVAVLRNDEQAVTVALAVAALGATLSTASPEMGTEALLDRFEQLSPRVLFAHVAALPFDTGTPIADKVARLAEIPSLDALVCIDDAVLPATVRCPVHRLTELIDTAQAENFVFRRFPFNQPLFIMFSSGTTGKPKCIVHGAGGSLVEHLKEHRLHSNLDAADKLYFHTSCAWMMWNWQLSALASGVEIVTYDGPLAGVDTLWKLVADERVSVFGTSPAYLRMCSEAGLEPAARYDLSALRAMMSTGAVLFDTQFHWVSEQVKPLQLQSISGGTDILGCFVLGNPNLPVYAGEAQCKSLALDVQAWEDGKPASGTGELVCTKPFPSRPLGFYGDADGARFHAAYFAANPGVWTHGDFIEFSAAGSARLHGRSDGVLNVRGINVGPGEIYRVLNDIPGIREAMVVQQKVPRKARSTSAANVPNAAANVAHSTATDEYDRRVVLLVVLQAGATLNAALIARVRRDLARRASHAHVPDLVLAVDALPLTHSGKLSDAAARDAVNGVAIRNTGALRNPESLEAIRLHPGLQIVETTTSLPPVGETAEQLELYLKALWERLFDFGPIERDDSFFDLGGDSLMAAALIAQLEGATGTELSLATLMNAPTIAQLAATVRSDSTTAHSPTIVPMRAGSGTPVFWVHSMAGSVMECLPVVRAMRSTRPFYGLHARGLSGHEAPMRDIPQMAEFYIAEIRRIQPHGPYALAGYSFGGLIALEIAQRLHRAGEAIESLCVLDSYVHERSLPWGDWLRYQGHYAKRQWTALRAVPRAQLSQFVEQKLHGVADKVRLRLGLMAQRPVPEIAHFPPVLQRVRESMRLAMTIYRPQRYEGGPIVFVRAAVQVEDRCDPLPLWRHIARKGLAIAHTSGGHVDMILEPHVDSLAATLDRALNGEIVPSTAYRAATGVAPGRYA